MSSPADDIQIRMTPKERAVFERIVANQDFYLEFGCGGSTEVALRQGCKKIVSVESDLDWIKRLREKPAVAEAVARQRLQFEHVDIGPVGEWGVPKDESKIRNWPKYFTMPFLKYDYLYSFIFIDGRFRNACAYAAYSFMTEDAILAVHDYTVRASYHDIEKFFDLVEEVDTLGVFKKKKNILHRALYMSILTNLFNP